MKEKTIVFNCKLCGKPFLQTNKHNMNLHMAKHEKIKMKEAMNIEHENEQDVVVTCKDKKSHAGCEEKKVDSVVKRFEERKKDSQVTQGEEKKKDIGVKVYDKKNKDADITCCEEKKTYSKTTECEEKKINRIARMPNVQSVGRVFCICLPIRIIFCIVEGMATIVKHVEIHSKI